MSAIVTGTSSSSLLYFRCLCHSHSLRNTHHRFVEWQKDVHSLIGVLITSSHIMLLVNGNCLPDTWVQCISLKVLVLLSGTCSSFLSLLNRLFMLYYLTDTQCFKCRIPFIYSMQGIRVLPPVCGLLRASFKVKHTCLTGDLEKLILWTPTIPLKKKSRGKCSVWA